MPCGPLVEVMESTTACPKLSHSSTQRHMDRSISTTCSGRGRGANAELWAGSVRALCSAQHSSQKLRPLRIAVATSLDPSSAFRDSNGTVPGLRDTGIEQSSMPPSSQQLLSALKGEGSCTSQSLPIPRLHLQTAPGPANDGINGSRQGRLIELRQNYGSSARAPATAASAFNYAGQQDLSDADSSGGSAASTFTGGQTRTAIGGSTEMHAMYDGWAPRAAVEAATQHGRATSVLPQGSRRSSDLTPCMRSQQDAPGNSAMSPHRPASPAVVPLHLRSIAQFLMPPTS